MSHARPVTGRDRSTAGPGLSSLGPRRVQGGDSAGLRCFLLVGAKVTPEATPDEVGVHSGRTPGFEGPSRKAPGCATLGTRDPPASLPAVCGVAVVDVCLGLGARGRGGEGQPPAAALHPPPTCFPSRHRLLGSLSVSGTPGRV